METKVIGVAIVFGCGLYELFLATSDHGHGWQFAAGIAFICFAAVRGFYLARSPR